MDSTVIVPPLWDKHLIAHLKQDPQIGITTPATAESSYNSAYKFESDAWSIYNKNKGLNVFSDKIDVPCIIIDCSAVGEDKYHNLTGLISAIVNKGCKIAIAKDTLVRHLNPRLKKKINKIRFKDPEAKLLSVLIPSYNNKEKLLKCLESLFNQKDVDYKKLEIIVVDDGSEDGTVEALGKIKAPCKFRYYSRSHKGWSAAINRGIVEAVGSFILLTSPYVIADENLISEHLKTHEKYSGEDIAVLGHISASPQEGIGGITPFMKFLLKSPKIQYNYEFAFDYNDIEYPENVEYKYFYTPNLSLKRDIFQNVGLFEEGFQHGVQDLEFGFRVSLNKYRIVYNRDAVVDLYRRIDLEGFLERQISVGRQKAILSQIHPGIFDVNPIKMNCVRHLLGKERLVERAEELVDELEKMHEAIRNNYKFAGSSLLERCYIILSDYYYTRGINEVLSEQEGDNWLDIYIDGIDVELQHLNSENRAYELLMESYYRAGKGDFPAFLDGVEQAAQLIPMHASPYYALGSFYLNLEKHKPAEETFGKGLNKRKLYNSLSILPVEDEVLYYMWLAMACIPQGKYKKAAEVLEELIAERLPVSVEQGSFIYKCLSLSYKALGEKRKALFCKEESERLKEDLKIA
ncbi:MAG: glycosyltransferase [Desulfobacterales bacterium]|nr:glycosyltransferase [Desulfobacterales bacterium]